MVVGERSGRIRFDGRKARIVTDGQPADGPQPGAPAAPLPSQIGDDGRLWGTSQIDPPRPPASRVSEARKSGVVPGLPGEDLTPGQVRQSLDDWQAELHRCCRSRRSASCSGRRIISPGTITLPENIVSHASRQSQPLRRCWNRRSGTRPSGDGGGVGRCPGTARCRPCKPSIHATAIGTDMTWPSRCAYSLHSMTEALTVPAWIEAASRSVSSQSFSIARTLTAGRLRAGVVSATGRGATNHTAGAR